MRLRGLRQKLKKARVDPRVLAKDVGLRRSEMQRILIGAPVDRLNALRILGHLRAIEKERRWRLINVQCQAMWETRRRKAFLAALEDL